MRYYAERSIANAGLLRELKNQHPEIEWIDDYQTFRSENIVREKESVIFASKRGAWLKPFHCYDDRSGYQYFSIDLAEGCSFDCVYCYLQSYLNHGALVIFLNIRDLQDELRNLSGENLWLSTGLLSDSILAESQFPVLAQISELIPKGSVLEMRTKSAEIEAMKNPGIDREKVVLSWSLNPETIVQRFEYRTASLQARLDAAHRAIELGYRVGFHFDPVFHFAGWEEAYSKLFESIRIFKKENIAFLSVGLFRYMPQLGSIIRRRFPMHSVLAGEFLMDSDGKYHYLRGIRTEMYQSFAKWLEPWKTSVPVFLSMEPQRREDLEF